jgi:hypothetical protein
MSLGRLFTSGTHAKNIAGSTEIKYMNGAQIDVYKFTWLSRNRPLRSSEHLHL